MNLERRQFLIFFGATAGTVALGAVADGKSGGLALQGLAAAQDLAFQPVPSPMPYPALGLAPEQQMVEFSTFTVADDLVLPAGYTYDVIGAWGDAVGDSRFGYNNDYLSYVETADGEGYLSINFEYISLATWDSTFKEIIGKDSPLAAVLPLLEAAGDDGINVYAMNESDPIKARFVELCEEGLTDVGIGVVSIQQGRNGAWTRTNSAADRRITGISGLKDGRYLMTTGPAAAVFKKTSGQGYIDGLGDRIIGTFNNCAGGTTPWGTLMSAEENFQSTVIEAVYADGTAMDPGMQPFSMGNPAFGSALGYAGNKYGWMVEVDPANPDDTGTKHTWLGRFRHEAVAVRAVAGKPLAVYSGCDRRGGHLYKFVSTSTVGNPQDKANSALMTDGMLYAAKFDPDGTGRWIPLKADTAVNPDLPSTVAGGMITLPKRPDGGYNKVESDDEVKAFARQYKTLGDLYEGNAEEQQGAILIDAHYAANAAGATHTARPEDTDVAADGTLYIAFTSGGSGGDGGPNNTIFQGPNGEQPYEHGWIMKLREDNNDPGAMAFRWDMLALGGEPAEGGMGFSNPDNLEIDASGNLWMVTDMSTSKHNLEVPDRVDKDGKPVSQSNLRGLFGNNSIWYIPTSGPNAGAAFMFGYGPMECEMCGPYLTKDQSTLFLAAQHPGESNGIRKDMAAETRSYAMKTTDGEDFMQQREVPIGSNWPGKTANAAPRPAVVAVRRIDGGILA